MKKILLLISIFVCIFVPAYAEEFSAIYRTDNFDSTQEYAYDGTNEYFAVEIDGAVGNPAPSRKIAQGKRLIEQRTEIRNEESGIVGIEADLMCDTFYSERVNLLSIFDLSGNTCGFEFKLHRNYIYLDAYNSSGERVTLPLAPYETGVWFNLAYSLNLGTRELKVYVNGERILFDEPVFANVKNENYCRIFSIDKRYISGNLWIDNPVVYRDIEAEAIPFADIYNQVSGFTLPTEDSFGRPLRWEMVTALQESKMTALRCFVQGEKEERTWTYFVNYKKPDDFDLSEYIDFNITETASDTIVLPRFTSYGAPIVWQSDNNSVLDSFGNVKRLKNDTVVTLKAVSGDCQSLYSVKILGYSNADGLYIENRDIRTEGNALIYEVKLYNGGEEKKINIILASYDENRVLKDVKIEEIKLLNGENMVSATVSDLDGVYHKGFLWSDDRISPIDDYAQIQKTNPMPVYVVIGGGNLFNGMKYSDGFVYDNDKVLFTDADLDRWYSMKDMSASPAICLKSFGLQQSSIKGETVGIMDFSDNRLCFDEEYKQSIMEKISKRSAKTYIDGIIFAPPEGLLDENKDNIALMFGNYLAELVWDIRYTAGDMQIPVILCLPHTEKKEYAGVLTDIKNAINNSSIVETEDLPSEDGILLTNEGAEALGRRISEVLANN